MKLFIITYHFIKNYKKEKYKSLNGLDASEFRKQIDYIDKNYEVISFDQLEKKNFNTKKNKIILTFDDGYSDHYSIAFKELRDRKMTGYFFPVVDVVEKNRVLDINKVHIILNFYKNKKKLLSELICFLSNFVKKKKLNHIIRKIKKRRFDDKKVSVIKSLFQNKLEDNLRKKALNFFFKKFVKKENIFHKNFYLNISQIKQMISGNMNFGSHGVSHVRFEEMSFLEQQKEIKKSILFFNKLNLPINVLCFPHGSYNRNSTLILKKLKFKFGLTLKHGYVNLNNKYNPFLLPRIDAKIFFKSLKSLN